MKIFTTAGTNKFKFAILKVLFFTFLLFLGISFFSRLPAGFEKFTEAFELKCWPDMSFRVFYKRCVAFFDENDTFLATFAQISII